MLGFLHPDGTSRISQAQTQTWTGDRQSAALSLSLRITDIHKQHKYIHTLTYTHTGLHAYVHTLIQTHTLAQTYIHVHLNIHTDTDTHIHIHTHAHTHVYTMHTHTHVHSNTYIYRHTHTKALMALREYGPTTNTDIFP